MDLHSNIQEWMYWSVLTFEKATVLSSLKKLDDELLELKAVLNSQMEYEVVAEEYVDCIMCLLHSASKYGIEPSVLASAFQRKFTINKMRTWNLNANNTYSHAREF